MEIDWVKNEGVVINEGREHVWAGNGKPNKVFEKSNSEWEGTGIGKVEEVFVSSILIDAAELSQSKNFIQISCLLVSIFLTPPAV